jgi:hypothetical protein
MADEKTGKICFFIAPIGSSESNTRRRSDLVLKHIIKPIAEERGYRSVIRADDLAHPGLITNDVIQLLINADLVIADLSEGNPNVAYELAVRHAIRKPVVQIIRIGDHLPFDFAQSRTIQFDHTDLDSVADCKDQLRDQIKAVEKDPSRVDNPISSAIDLMALQSSGQPSDKALASILSAVENLSSQMQYLRETHDLTPEEISAAKIYRVNRDRSTRRLGREPEIMTALAALERAKREAPSEVAAAEARLEYVRREATIGYILRKAHELAQALGRPATPEEVLDSGFPYPYFSSMELVEAVLEEISHL